MASKNTAVFGIYATPSTAESAVDHLIAKGFNNAAISVLLPDDESTRASLTLADFIGLDICLDIMRVLQDGTGDPKYRPCPLLVRMVDAGWLGRKSGRGFYSYPASI